MPNRSTALTLAELKIAIVRQPLIMAPETRVVEAIAQMSGVRAMCSASKTADGQLHELYLEARSSCVLVLQDNELRGILTERDVVRLIAQQQPLQTLTLREVMVSPVVTLREADFTDRFFALNLLKQYHIRHLPILDDQNQPMGLVTHESLQQTTRPVDLLRLRSVSEVMTSAVICAAPESTMLAIAQQMARHRVSAVMIVQLDDSQAAPLQRPIGIVTERDLVQFQALGLDLETCLAQAVMSTPIFAVQPDASLWTVQQTMEQHFIRRLAVTGSHGQLLGIVTLTSVLQALNPLELYKLAEVLAGKVGRLEAEKVALLENRTVELEHQVEARTSALKVKAQQEQLVVAIATQIRSSLSLQTILDTTVEQVRQLLGCDRVNIWRFDASWRTIAVAESTDSSPSLLGEQINDTCFQHDQAELYRQGRIRVVPDIYETAMSDCHRKLLIRLQTRAKIMVPLLCGDQLWGLLNATESQHAREWQPDEVELLQALAVQLAIALQQATTHQQLQEELNARQHTEIRLRDSEQRYASLAAAVPVGIFRTDTAGYGIYHNDRWYQIAGLSPDAAAGLGWLQGVHPDDRDRVASAWQQSLQAGYPFQQEYRFQRADGQVTWVYGQTVAERNAQGQVIGYAGTITDISDRKQAEAALIKSEAQSRAILAAIPDFMFRIGEDGTYRECVAANCEIDFLPADSNPVGLSMSDVLPVEIATRQQHYLEQALRTGAVQVYEQQVQHGDRLQDEEIRVVKSGDDEALFMIRDISDRKRSEEALKRSEAHQRALISAIPDLITRINRAGIYLEFVASPNFHIVGNLPEIVGTHVFDSLPPDLAQQRMALIQQVLRTNTIQMYEQDLSVAGRTQIEEVRVVPYSEEEVLVLVRDISDRKKAEAENQQASNQIARQLLIIEAAIDGIAILQGGTFQYLNKSHVEMFGYTLSSELLGQSWQQLYSTEEVHRFQQEVFPALEANGYWQGEAIATRKDGSSFYEEVSLTFSSNGDLICVCRDISERKRAEIELRLHKDQLAQLAAIVESSHDAIISITPDGMITSWNQSAERLFGYTTQEMIGSPVAMLIPSERDVEERWSLESIYQGHSVNTYETQRQCKDGSLVEVALTVSPIWGENGTVIGASKIVRDISDRKRAEAALQNLIAGTAATTGQDFFPALVNHIAQALHVSYAIVSELVEEELHALAFWANGTLQPTFSYHPAQTPCEQTLQDGRFYCGSFIQNAFPHDSDLVEMQAYSYLGIALKDSNGIAIGNLCILDQRTIQDSKRAEQILQVFAARAAAELGRQRAKIQLQQLNQELETKVKQRTAALQVSEATNRIILEAIPDLLLRLKRDGTCFDYIKPGIETENFLPIDHHIAEVLPPDLLHNQLQVIDRAINTQALQVYEHQFLKCDRMMYEEIRVLPMNDQEVLVIVRDISDRKQAEQTIRQQAEREILLREITQRIRESLDLQTIFDTACREIRQVLQADRVGIFKFDPEATFEQGAFVAEAVVGGFSSVVAIQVHDHCFGEKYAPLYIQGRYAAMDDIYRLDECHTNVLALFQVRANLVMPLICGEALWGLLCIHQCATVRHWQQSEIDFTQQIANQLAIGIQQANLFEQLQQELAERQQTEAKLTESNQQLARSNQELARATRLKDEFLANMSHELRTPLNAILGMTEGLQEQVFGNINEQQRKALQTVERSGTHLLELINDILDVAKIEAGQIELDFTAISVAHLCRSSLAFINQQALQKQIQLEIKLQLNLPDLLVDERRIRQVLINLLNNAVKFTPQGGRITLEARGQAIGVNAIATTSATGVNHESRNQTHQGIAASNSWILLSVIDTGIGIAPEHINQLFQPFVQIDSALNRQYTGTGLGLALVKQLVELHGGRVELTSELGVGSCFTIELPCIPNLPHPPVLTVSEPLVATLELDASLANATPPPGALILLAEDNEANVNTVSSYLKAKGYRLLLAKNGPDAIDLATTHQPDLILMDIQMPGMDGLETVRQIRLDPGLVAIPIIALTALAMTGDRGRCLEAGANDYLTKPVKLKQLAAIIQHFLDANNHP